MNRRSFLQSILAVGMAPAVVRAENLMKMVRRESGLVVPEWVYPDMDGVFDDNIRWTVGPQLGDSIVVRRWLPYSTELSVLSEGIMPSGECLRFEEIIVTLDERRRGSRVERSSRTAPRAKS